MEGHMGSGEEGGDFFRCVLTAAAEYQCGQRGNTGLYQRAGSFWLTPGYIPCVIFQNNTLPLVLFYDYNRSLPGKQPGIAPVSAGESGQTAGIYSLFTKWPRGVIAILSFNML